MSVLAKIALANISGALAFNMHLRTLSIPVKWVSLSTTNNKHGPPEFKTLKPHARVKVLVWKKS